MAIDRATVEHVARLARLALGDDERERFVGQLARILEHCARLDAITIEGVPATSHVLPIVNVLREDLAEPSLPRDEVFSAAPAHAQGFFRVPRVLISE